MDNTTVDFTQIKPIDPIINAGDIGATPQLNLQTPTQPTNLLAGLADTTQTTADASTASQNKEANTYTNLLNQLGMESADTLALQNEKGVATSERELLDLQKVANKQQADYIAGITQAEMARNTRQETGIVQQNITRQHAIDALLTNSLIASKQGDITYANTLVDRAIKAKYDPIRAQIDAQKFVLDQINTKAAQDRTNALNVKLKQIEKDQKNEEDLQKLFTESAANGAPTALLEQAKLAKTPLQAAQILGKYGGDYLKAELLREQIKTEQAQRSKIYNDMKASSDKLLTIDEAAKLGVPYGTTQAQAIAQSQGQVGKPVPLNPVQQSALKSAKQLRDSLENDFGPLKGAAPIGINKFVTIPGTKRADFNINFDNVKSLLSLDNVKLLKGQGSVSDAERQLLSDASTKLNRSQSPEEFKKTLDDIILTFEKASPDYQYTQSVENALNNPQDTFLSADAYANSLTQ